MSGACRSLAKKRDYPATRRRTIDQTGASEGVLFGIRPERLCFVGPLPISKGGGTNHTNVHLDVQLTPANSEGPRKEYPRGRLCDQRVSSLTIFAWAEENGYLRKSFLEIQALGQFVFGLREAEHSARKTCMVSR